MRAIRSAADGLNSRTSAFAGRGWNFAAARSRTTRAQIRSFARGACPGAPPTCAKHVSAKTAVSCSAAHAASPLRASVGALSATEWSGPCTLSTIF
ncbi:hypothetical protein OAO87_03920 [bacterium]|nr:hypothetical protein [bacterium]